MLLDEVSRRHVPCASFSRNCPKDGSRGCRLARQQIVVCEGILFDKRVDCGLYGIVSRQPLGGIPRPIQNDLDIPCDAIEPIIKTLENLGVEGSSRLLEEIPGKCRVFPAVDGFEGHQLRALVEGASGKDEHLLHKMALRAGENESGVVAKLDMAAEESFHAIFREVAHLLELVNRYDWNRLARLYELKCILKRRFSLRREDIKGELGHSIRLRRHCQPDTAEEVGNPPASLFGTCRKASDNGGGKSLHELREIANVENVDVKRLTLAANFMEEMMDELEAIVFSGTKININYFIQEVVDPDEEEEIYDYFKNADDDNIKKAMEALGEDYYDEMHVRLVRLKFHCDLGN